MSDRLSTKAGVFESGEKDVMGVQYKDGRVIACRNSKLEEYTVADGTEVICDRAFMNLKELRSIKLPASLRAIGESAFSGCKALTDINIPEGVTEIRQATFRDCNALTAIELPASVTTIDKFAFGRGLTTLVVNAAEMSIDKYAFMNARDFATLIVPAGSADYYHTLLADMRVKADVEEAETEDDEPQSMLDMFASASADEANEMTKGLFKSNNKEEEKKTKIVIVEVFGKELFLEPKDPDEEEVYDAYSRFARNGMVITVDGREYAPIDLGIDYKVLTQEQIDEFKNFDVAEFFEKSGAKEGMLYTNKACTTIEIEIPEDEEFDQNKACLVTKKFLYPDESSDVTVCAFGYDGKVYDCAPGDSTGISGEKIWPCSPDAETDDNDYLDDDEDWNDDDYVDNEEANEMSEEKYSILELKGRGVIIDAEGESSYYYAAIKSDLQVILNGKDITDSVSWAENYEAFMANKILDEESGLDFYMSEDDVELPGSVFHLPENADPELIQLLPINRDFSDLYEDATLADFIIYDGEELEADNYYDNRDDAYSQEIFDKQTDLFR